VKARSRAEGRTGVRGAGVGGGGGVDLKFEPTTFFEVPTVPDRDYTTESSPLLG